MEHKLNKVDVEIIQKVLELTKEEMVHEIRKTTEGSKTAEENRKKDSQEESLRGDKEKKIQVSAYKKQGSIEVKAWKSVDSCSGKYIDKKR